MNIKLQIVDNKAFRQNSLIYPLYTTHYSKILDIQTKNLHLTVKKNNYFFIFNLQSACAFSSASSLLLDNVPTTIFQKQCSHLLTTYS